MENEADERNDAVDEISVALAKLRSVVSDVSAVNNESTDIGSSLALSPGAEVSAVSIKKQLASLRAETLRKQQALIDARKELAAKMEAELARANEMMAPLQQMLARLQEGIWTVNLYLGRDEEIFTIRDGEPAPADTPISVRQQVLAMDEECAIMASDGGMDARHVDQFMEWLLRTPENLQQVLPEIKGVVVLVPRRQEKDYGDPFINLTMRMADKQSYWLLRNGERLYGMVTDFRVGTTLVPKRDEFLSFFTDRMFGLERKLTPGSREWLQAQEQADARKRHYMRVALILQGLLDRTTVFHPLPRPNLNLLSHEDYDAGLINVITDAEMNLHDGTEPFYQWLSRLNKQLRPGMRIIGNFDDMQFTSLHPENNPWRHFRLRPRGASLPQSLVVHTLVERKPDGALVFHYQRTDTVWRRYGDSGEAERRASCAIHHDDRFILPVDLVTIAEMEHYLKLRTERHAYATMLPLLEVAIAVKREEEEAESPFRKLLTGELMKHLGLGFEQSEKMVSELVHWWKLANRWHRPLVGTPEQESRALKGIIREARIRLREEVTTHPGQALALSRLAEVAPNPLLLGRERSGRYVAFVAAEPDRNVFVHKYSVAASGKGAIDTTEWILPGDRWRQWQLITSDARWDAWLHNAVISECLTGPETAECVERIKKELSDQYEVMAIRSSESDSEFKVYIKPELRGDEHLILSAHEPEFFGKRFYWTWRRHREGLELKRWANWEEKWTWPRRTDDKFDWDVSYWGRRRREDYHRNEVVYRNEAAIAACAPLEVRYRELCAVRTRLLDRAREYGSALEANWKLDAEKAAYARFVEDYGDTSLWEGHRKALRFTPPDALRKATTVAASLLEHEIEPSGLLIGDALDKLEALQVEQLPTDAYHSARGVTSLRNDLAAFLDVKFPNLKASEEHD